MKNIAIFCDGTWQQLGTPHPTNVVKLARAVPSWAGSTAQLVFYDNGVGVGEGVLNRTTRVLGGAFGHGLDHKIAEAYQFLCFNYEPGDRIFLFGFSRGAYTARSLGGLLQRVWILRREHANKIADAIALYRRAPDENASDAEKKAAETEQKAFNADWGHQVGRFTGDKAYRPGDPDSLTPADPEACGWIQFVGVWDTVGSMGIPPKLPFAPDFNKKYRFHNLRLSRFVRSARHAVALDEQREAFAPSLWSNIGPLNANAEALRLPYGDRPYQQQWFPGGHGTVGGGELDVPISNAALLWIAEGARRAGLALDAPQIARFAQETNAAAPFAPVKSSLRSRALSAVGKKTRAQALKDENLAFPVLEEVSFSAQVRCAERVDYEPEVLAGLREAMRTAPPAKPYLYT